MEDYEKNPHCRRHSENLYFLQVLLSANGFDVEQASNGVEALERARRAPPHMIISDILMR